jgi:hypothetical protein
MLDFGADFGAKVVFDAVLVVGFSVDLALDFGVVFAVTSVFVLFALLFESPPFLAVATGLSFGAADFVLAVCVNVFVLSEVLACFRRVGLFRLRRCFRRRFGGRFGYGGRRFFSFRRRRRLCCFICLGACFFADQTGG